LRILIAEDEPDIWIPYKIILEKRGHVVDIAEDGEQCLEKYMTTLRAAAKKKESNDDRYTDRGSKRRITTTRISNSTSSHDNTLTLTSLSLSSLPLSPFDAVVLDYRMPKKDGLEVAKDILAANPSQRIIFASAYVKETLKESVKELKQVVELMQKPFLPQALVDIVEDSEAYPELKKLLVNVSKMTEIDFENPTPDQIRDIFEGLKKIQKGRTF
jgi:CheY-like chemotaxis protein